MADEPYDAKSHLRYLEDRVSVAQRALKKDPKNLALIKALQEASVAALAITCVGKPRPHLRTHEERHSFRKAARLSFYAPIDQCCANCHKVPDATAKLRRCGRCREAMYCNAECQRADWKRHKADCNRRLEKANEADACVLHESMRPGLLRDLDRQGFSVVVHQRNTDAVMRDGDGVFYECVSDNPVWFSDEIAGCKEKRQDERPGESTKEYVDRRIGTDWEAKNREAHAALVAKRESFLQWADEKMRDVAKVWRVQHVAFARRLQTTHPGMVRARQDLFGDSAPNNVLLQIREMFFSPGGHFGEARRSSLRWSKAEAAKQLDGLIAKHFGRPPPVQDRAAVDHWEEIKGMDEEKVFASREYAHVAPRDPTLLAEMKEEIEALQLENREAPKPTSSSRGY